MTLFAMLKLWFGFRVLDGKNADESLGWLGETKDLFSATLLSLFTPFIQFVRIDCMYILKVCDESTLQHPSPFSQCALVKAQVDLLSLSFPLICPDLLLKIASLHKQDFCLPDVVASDIATNAHLSLGSLPFFTAPVVITHVPTEKKMVQSMALIVANCFFSHYFRFLFFGNSPPRPHEMSILWLCSVISLTRCTVPALSSQT